MTNLTTDLGRESATIYRFPPRGRYAAGAANQATRFAERASPYMPSPALGSGWYHDEAIREERDRKE
jgi:hypothetical protein